jgi:hypothetical protein
MSLESHLLPPVLENTKYHFPCSAKTGYKMLISFEGWSVFAKQEANLLRRQKTRKFGSE